jgi:hypothetical protein
VAEGVGLTDALSDAMAVTRRRKGGHDRGKVLTDLAVMLADDGKSISDLCSLRDQPRLFGEVASTPTAWRDLGGRGRIGDRSDQRSPRHSTSEGMGCRRGPGGSM